MQKIKAKIKFLEEIIKKLGYGVLQEADVENNLLKAIGYVYACQVGQDEKKLSLSKWSKKNP